MAPWKGARHRSWASDTAIAGAILAVLLIATGVADVLGEPSNYLIGLLGTATGTFFGALSTDKAKRDAEIARSARRAETKVDALAEVAKREHPDSYKQVNGDADRPCDADEGDSP